MPEKILMALSGGVDSAVAAALLKQAGHELICVTMRICSCDAVVSDENMHHGCYGMDKTADINDAQRVARHLGTPIHVIDLCDAYEKDVLDEVIAGYSHGRTPNPCIYCNPRIKFGALVESAQKAGLQFEHIATGHYAKVEYDSTRRRYLLKKGVDEQKDQSYFLSFLNQGHFKRVLFPLGCYSKPQVRNLAAEMGLPVPDKPESQDFVSGGYHGLLHDIGQPGPIVDAQGCQLGTHRGIAHYTIGQHKGLDMSQHEKLYVVKILPEANTIVVGREEDLFKREFVVRCLNWIAIDAPSSALRAEVKIRSKSLFAEATIEPQVDDVRVIFDVPQKCITPGQAAVFYHDDVVLGAGIIDSVPDESYKIDGGNDA